MKIIFTEDKVFSCPLGKWIKESDNILSELLNKEQKRPSHYKSKRRLVVEW